MLKEEQTVAAASQAQQEGRCGVTGDKRKRGVLGREAATAAAVSLVPKI